MVVFSSSRVASHFQTPIGFTAVKQGSILDKNKYEAFSTLIWTSLMTQAIGGVYSTKKRRAETLQPGLEVGNLKPPLKQRLKGTFKCISWLNGLCFEGWRSGFYERESQGLSSGTNVASQIANIYSVFTSVVCGVAVISRGEARNSWKWRKEKPNIGFFTHTRVPRYTEFRQ